MRGLSRKQVAALSGLWVRVPRLPPSSSTVRRYVQSRGPAATTPGLHPGNDGSSPSGTICGTQQIACRRHHSARRSSRSSLECSPGLSTRRSWVQIPSRTLSATALDRGTVRKLAKRRSSNLRELRVQLPPVSLKSFNWVVFLTAACKPVVHETSEVDDERFKSFTTHSVLRVSSSIVGPFVYRHRTAAPQAAKAGSIPARVNSQEH